MGGSPKRMKKIAEILLKALDIQLPCGTGLANIACTTDRYEMYKVGPILSVSVSLPHVFAVVKNHGRFL